MSVPYYVGRRQLLYTNQTGTIFSIVGTGWICCIVTNACSATVCKNRGLLRFRLRAGSLKVEMMYIDTDNVCHREEGRQAGSNFRKKFRTFALFLLSSHIASATGTSVSGNIGDIRGRTHQAGTLSRMSTCQFFRQLSRQHI
jgi:hypothetical protein